MNNPVKSSTLIILIVLQLAVIFINPAQTLENDNKTEVNQVNSTVNPINLTTPEPRSSTPLAPMLPTPLPSKGSPKLIKPSIGHLSPAQIYLNMDNLLRAETLGRTKRMKRSRIGDTEANAHFGGGVNPVSLIKLLLANRRLQSDQPRNQVKSSGEFGLIYPNGYGEVTGEGQWSDIADIPRNEGTNPGFDGYVSHLVRSDLDSDGDDLELGEAGYNRDTVDDDEAQLDNNLYPYDPYIPLRSIRTHYSPSLTPSSASRFGFGVLPGQKRKRMTSFASNGINNNGPSSVWSRYRFRRSGLELNPISVGLQPQQQQRHQRFIALSPLLGDRFLDLDLPQAPPIPPSSFPVSSDDIDWQNKIM